MQPKFKTQVIMNRYIVLFSFCAVFFAAAEVRAQEKTVEQQVDSILAILPQLKDSVKLRAIRDIAFLTQALPTSKQYLYMYLEEAQKQKNIEEEGLAWAQLTGFYQGQFDSDSVYIIGKKALDFMRKHKRYANMAYVQGVMIKRYNREGKLLTALRMIEEGYQEAKQLQESTLMATMLASLGHMYYNIEQFEDAIRYYLESIEAEKQESEPKFLRIAPLYDNLAYMERYVNRPSGTLRYVDSLKTYLNYYNQKHPEHNVQPYHYFAECYRAIAYAEMNQPQDALQTIRKAEEMYDPKWSETNKYYSAIMNDMYAAYYFAAGNYNKALERLDLLLDYYQNPRAEFGVYLTNKRKAQTYLAMGNYKAAADLYCDILHRKDSINKEKLYAQINELRTIFQLDRVELESERKTTAIRQYRLAIFGLATIVLALTFISALIAWNRKRINEKNRGLYLQIKEQDCLKEELKQMKQELSAYKPDKSVVETIQQNGNAKQKQLVDKLNEYLLLNKKFTDFDIEHSEIVSALSTNKTYLFDAVKTVTGKTVQEYINCLRLEEVKKMLDSPSKYTIESMALECGFNSYQTFHRLFKQRYKLSPAEYSKLAKREELV